MQSDQRSPVSFSFFLYKTKNLEIVENSPKDKEKMLLLEKYMIQKKRRCYSNQSAKNSKMYVIIIAIDNIVPFILYKINYI